MDLSWFNRESTDITFKRNITIFPRYNSIISSVLFASPTSNEPISKFRLCLMKINRVISRILIQQRTVFNKINLKLYIPLSSSSSSSSKENGEDLEKYTCNVPGTEETGKESTLILRARFDKVKSLGIYPRGNCGAQWRFDKKKPLVFNPISNRISDATGCYYRSPYRGIGIRADSLSLSLSVLPSPVKPGQSDRNKLPSFQCGPVSPPSK